MDEEMTIPRKILVVDDEDVFCENLKNFLTRLGYTVITAQDGEKALAMIRTEKPDLVTLDIRMPGVNGFEVLNHLRFGRHDGLKILVISAIDIPETPDHLLRAGAHAVLHKPVDLTLLAAKVKELL